MGYQDLKSDVLFYQRFLKANGFYDNGLDGDWGPHTIAADASFRQQSEAIKAQYGNFDPRSEDNLITLIPQAQILARRFLAIVRGKGIDVRIISGTRTYMQQDALYQQGRNGHPGPVVTNAKGGQSNHNFGLAWDIGVFDNNKYITLDQRYKDIAPIALPLLTNLEWGGNWMSLKDYPHYQFKAKSDSVAVIRAAFEDGTAYV